MKRDQEEEKKAQELLVQVDTLWKGRLAVWESINNTIEEVTTKARQAITPTEIVLVGEKLKVAMTMKEKLEAGEKVISENKVGEKRVVVGNKVLKMAKIILAHIQLIDGRGKAKLEDAVNKISTVMGDANSSTAGRLTESILSPE